MAIAVSDLTTGVVDGTGVYDVMMRSTLAQLDKQLADGKITYDQYATIYPQLAMQTMSAAIQFLNAQQQALTNDKQQEVLEEQRKGFERDALQRFAKSMMDIWSVQRSTDEGIKPTPENKLTDDNIGKSIQALATSLNVTLT